MNALIGLVFLIAWLFAWPPPCRRHAKNDPLRYLEN
jgi:hypothetical protein